MRSDRGLDTRRHSPGGGLHPPLRTVCHRRPARDPGIRRALRGLREKPRLFSLRDGGTQRDPPHRTGRLRHARESAHDATTSPVVGGRDVLGRVYRADRARARRLSADEPRASRTRAHQANVRSVRGAAPRRLRRRLPTDRVAARTRPGPQPAQAALVRRPSRPEARAPGPSVSVTLSESRTSCTISSCWWTTLAVGWLSVRVYCLRPETVLCNTEISE
mmetsp:Transcript_3998/g.6619  ORF Transcript_3998/g.6619 Transcript_3998/m.6619 type:complete len:219 (-) Transcript_3998:34-690(-)